MESREAAKTVSTVLKALVPDRAGQLAVISLLLGDVMDLTAPAQDHQSVTAVVPPPGKLRSAKGDGCYCSTCKRDVYRLRNNLYDNMKTQDFQKSFEPLGHLIDLPRIIDIYTDGEGNIATDCPVCKGDKTLWLIGRGKALDLNQPIESPEAEDPS